MAVKDKSGSVVVTDLPGDCTATARIEKSGPDAWSWSVTVVCPNGSTKTETGSVASKGEALEVVQGVALRIKDELMGPEIIELELNIN